MTAGLGDERPNCHHQGDPQLVQLAHHGAWVRPAGRVEAPVSLVQPVEEVYHDDGDGQRPGNAGLDLAQTSFVSSNKYCKLEFQGPMDPLF